MSEAEKGIDFSANMPVSVTLAAGQWGMLMELVKHSTGIPYVAADPILKGIHAAIVGEAIKQTEAQSADGNSQGEGESSVVDQAA